MLSHYFSGLVLDERPFVDAAVHFVVVFLEQEDSFDAVAVAWPHLATTATVSFPPERPGNSAASGHTIQLVWPPGHVRDYSAGSVSSEPEL